MLAPILTGLSERLIIEPCFADLEGMPFVAIKCLIYIDDIEVFVHPSVRYYDK